ncbi:MAG: flagellar basal body rod protein FlgB [Epsilonproteobacteria bacterium]|nr:flagellar basal body rod protein FlgB [Campylobacterota bacterium]
MQISRVHGLMAEALDYRSMRQDLISSNIANVDTPGYKARDIAFSDLLAQKREAIYPTESTRSLQLAQTDPRHLSGAQTDEKKRAEIFFRDGHLARNDGNTVDLDIETTEMAKNGIMYNAVIAAMKKDGAIFRSVLDASAKIQ